jgi:DNA-binding NarL/FixJ family response regulator
VGYLRALVTVLVADPHAPSRAGVRRSLPPERFEVVAEARDAEEAVSLALDARPDVCLVEVNLPGGGVGTARSLCERLPQSAIVMLTDSRSEADFFDSLRAGASGYLLKDLDPARLPHALEGVLAGEGALPRRLVPRLLEQFRGEARRRRISLKSGSGPALTARQWEVLELLRSGLTTGEIAARLALSPVTVRRHLSGAFAKLEVTDRDAALRLLA